MADTGSGSAGKAAWSGQVFTGGVSALLALVGMALLWLLSSMSPSGGRSGSDGQFSVVLIWGLGLPSVGALCGALGGYRAAKTGAFLGGLAGTAVVFLAPFVDLLGQVSAGLGSPATLLGQVAIVLVSFSISYGAGAGVGIVLRSPTRG